MEPNNSSSFYRQTGKIFLLLLVVYVLVTGGGISCEKQYSLLIDSPTKRTRQLVSGSAERAGESNAANLLSEDQAKELHCSLTTTSIDGYVVRVPYFLYYNFTPFCYLSLDIDKNIKDETYEPLSCTEVTDPTQPIPLPLPNLYISRQEDTIQGITTKTEGCTFYWALPDTGTGDRKFVLKYAKTNADGSRQEFLETIEIRVADKSENRKFHTGWYYIQQDCAPPSWLIKFPYEPLFL